MQIINEVKLDFSDVLILPKRSKLASRKDVDLTREFKFKHTGKTWKGLPIIASNMDSVGTFTVDKVLSGFNALTAIHKHYDFDSWTEFGKGNLSVFYSLGITNDDYDKYQKIKTSLGQSMPSLICIDVANGYSLPFEDFVKKFRDENPETIIMAGNVVTANMTEQLIISGVDIVKVGIGPGCFVPGTPVQTSIGIKSIENVVKGDEVLTHKGNWQAVSKTFQYKEDTTVVSVNGIKSTKHHEYYALHKQYKDVVTDENIHELAEWIPADKLTCDYFLLKHKGNKNGNITT